MQQKVPRAHMPTVLICPLCSFGPCAHMPCVHQPCTPPLVLHPQGLDISLAEYTLRQSNEDLTAAAVFLHDCLHADNSASAAAVAQVRAVRTCLQHGCCAAEETGACLRWLVGWARRPPAACPAAVPPQLVLLV